MQILLGAKVQQQLANTEMRSDCLSVCHTHTAMENKKKNASPIMCEDTETNFGQLRLQSLSRPTSNTAY